jgi:hypothetical protein
MISVMVLSPKKNWLLLVLFLGLSPLSCKKRQDAHTKASPVNRKLLGVGQPYHPPKDILDEPLDKSMAKRRQAAWAIIEQVVEEIEVGQTQDEFRPESNLLPLWNTWYEGHEINWMMLTLYDELKDQDRIQFDEAGAPKTVGSGSGADFCPEDLLTIFDRHEKKDISVRFDEDRYLRRLRQFRNRSEVRGISGTGITLFSPAIFSHYLANYRQVFQCDRLIPDLNRDTPPPTSKNFTHCFKSEFPGVQVAPAGVLSESNSEPEVGRSRYPSTCGSRQVPQKGLIREKFGTAVAIKTAWQLVEDNSEIAVFDTSARGLKDSFDSGHWQAHQYKKASEISDEEIYTIRTSPEIESSRKTDYQLTALHIITKDLRDWMWITLWWSPEPDTDFGADRPDHWPETSPWRQYKMCVVSDYREQDPSPEAELTEPTLRNAVAMVHERMKPHTWCSNPYIEQGLGNARTNCIGCHQHAGTGVLSENVYLDDPEDPENGARRRLFPDGGRAKIRKNFPGEYMWSFSDSPDFFQYNIRYIVNSYRDLGDDFGF